MGTNTYFFLLKQNLLTTLVILAISWESIKNKKK
jgi:hypothetical protein